MPERPDPSTRVELLAANAAAMDALDTLLARHTAAELTTAHDAAGWTAKDHLAHLTAWLRSVLEPARDGISRWEALGVSEAVFAARHEDDFFRINEQIRRRHAGEALGAGRKTLRETFEGAQAYLHEASDAELQRPVVAGDPADGEVTFFQLFDSDGWRHVNEHCGYIAIILGEAGAGKESSDRSTPATMDALLAANDAAWAALHALIARYPESELTTAHDPAGWTSKDHLAHLAAWERGVLHVLRDGWPEWQGIGVSEDVYATRYDDDLFAINEVIRRQHADRTLDDVLIELQAVHEAMQETIRQLGEEGLRRPVGDFRHDDTDFPVIDWIPGDACDHYDKHRGYIAIILGDA
ncbi:MAG: ClbS/DfsB family four-helix bundle protein [Thermomicrobiales bacterium]